MSKLTSTYITSNQLNSMTPLGLAAFYVALQEVDVQFANEVITKLNNLIGKQDANKLIEKFEAVRA